MSLDNSHETLKIFVRNNALGRLSSFADHTQAMWDICCGVNGVMYHHIYKHVFESGVAIDKKRLNHERPGWVVIKGDALEHIPSIPALPNFIDVDPYGTCIPFLEVIAPRVEGITCIVFHDFAHFDDYKFRKSYRKWLSSVSFSGVNKYIETEARLLYRNLFHKHGLLLLDWDAYLFGVNVHGHCIVRRA